MNAADVFNYVSVTDGECWEWTRGRTTHGYGRLNLGGYTYGHAHRVAYEQAYGPIPDGMVVRHRCDNPPCINPQHLEIGTQADNGRDAVERGRIRTGERAPGAKWPDSKVREAHLLRALGMTYADVANAIGVPFTAVREWLQGRVRHPENTRGPAKARR